MCWANDVATIKGNRNVLIWAKANAILFLLFLLHLSAGKNKQTNKQMKEPDSQSNDHQRDKGQFITWIFAWTPYTQASVTKQNTIFRASEQTINVLVCKLRSYKLLYIAKAAAAAAKRTSQLSINSNDYKWRLWKL